MSAHVLWYLGIGYPSPCKRHVHPEFARMGFVRNRDQYASVRGGFLSLYRRLRGSQPCGCTSPETGNDLLSLFLSPAEAGHMVGVAQRKSGGLQNRVSRVQIPPRPPDAHAVRQARSGNLLIYPKLTAGKDRPPGAMSRRLYGTVAQKEESLHRRTQRSPVRVRPVPPKGIRILQWVLAPAKRYWLLYVAAYNLGISAFCERRRYGSVSQLARARAHNRGHLGSTPSGTTNAKAMCGAWLGA